MSETGRQTLATAVADQSSAMIGPALSLFASSVPDFETLSVPELLANTDRLHHHYQTTPYYGAEDWNSQAKLCGAMSTVARELKDLGFRNYWATERLPLIKEAEATLTAHLRAAGGKLGEGIAAMLSPAFDEREDITLSPRTRCSIPRT